MKFWIILMSNLIVGLTGGIGSGKTAVSDWFFEQGIDIVDADVISRTITQKDSPLLQRLKDSFGDWVIDNDGNYNRPAMRQHIFNHQDDLKKLNTLMHPAIRDEIITQLKNSKSAYTILSVPLLFESYQKENSLMALCQRFLVVDVGEALQLERASKRDRTNIDAIKTIINNQISRSDRLSLAKKLNADIIDNSQGLEFLYRQLAPLHQHYLMLAQSYQ